MPRVHRPALRSSYVALGCALLACAPMRARAQDTTTAAAPAVQVVARGTVARTDGRPIAMATVYLLETLEETRSDSAGRFVLRSGFRGVATVVARGVGYLPSTIDVVLPTDSTLAFVLQPQAPILPVVTVVAAGEYTLGTGQTATLSPLQVAQTPGAAANVARAIQTLPGAQNVDEGTGLFVRGGDVTETRVLIDDAWMISPVRFDNPTGHVTSTINPFLLSRTVFSSGGFGARYGNALSGLVRMETADAPTTTTASFSASIGTLSASVATKPHARLGLMASAGLNNLGPLFSAFGQAQPFDPPPRGGDASGAIEWRTSRAGRLRLFGVRQTSRFGVGDAALAGSTRYGATTGEDFAVLSWRDSSTAWRPSITAAWSSHDRDETFGTFTLGTALAAPQLLASLAWHHVTGLVVTAGAEHEALRATYTGADATSGATARPVFSSTSTNVRNAVFVDAMRVFAPGVRVSVGVRRDNASLASTATIDPRLSVAWQRGTLGLTAAWGHYHQVAEPTFNRSPSVPFSPMRVEQRVVGVQWGTDSVGLRIEGYNKQYRALWQFTPDFTPVGNGIGRARGVDLHARWQLGASNMRLAYSHVSSVRTDPRTGVVAPSVADITHSVVWITERTIRAVTVSSALRYATGRPFTDITGAVVGVTPATPQYADPFAARLPAYLRSDLSLSWYRGLGRKRGMVLWGSAANLFARRNVMRYRFSDDYRSRVPVLAPFNRSLFVGSTLLL